MKLQKREQAQHGLFPFFIYKPIIIPAAALIRFNKSAGLDKEKNRIAA